MKTEYTEMEDFVYNYPTIYKEGFTGKEILKLIKELEIDKDEFFDKLGINTVMVKNNECLTYHCDILKGLNCVIENREQSIAEWD